MLPKPTTLPGSLLMGPSTGIEPTGPREAGSTADKLAVGKGFERILLGQMVSAMRATVPESTLWPNRASQGLYDQMMEQALVGHLAKAGGLGVAESLAGVGALERRPPGGTRPLPHVPEKQAGRGIGATVWQPVEGGRRAPLADQLPPQDDAWLDSPQAAIRLQALLTAPSDRNE